MEKQINDTVAIAGISPDAYSLATLISKACDLNCFDQNSSIIDEFEVEADFPVACTDNPATAFARAKLVFVTTPVTVDLKTRKSDSSSVSQMINLVRQYNITAPIVIMSPVEVGFTNRICSERNDDGIMIATMVAPTQLGGFTRAGDHFSPSLFKLVIGYDGNVPPIMRTVFQKVLDNDKVQLVHTTPTRAEVTRQLAFIQRITHSLLIYDMEMEYGICIDEIANAIGDSSDLQEPFCNPEIDLSLADMPGVIGQYLRKRDILPDSRLAALVEANEVRLRSSVCDVFDRYAIRVGLSHLR